MDWFVSLIQKFSGYNLGWHAAGYADCGVETWDAIGTLTLAWIGIVTVCSILHFLGSSQEHWSAIYIPLCIFYIGLNVLLQFSVACLFLVIGGPVGFCIIGLCYFIFNWVLFLIQLTEYNEVYGYFGLILFIIQFSNAFNSAAEYKKRMKTSYKKFLNIKYEL